MTFSQFTMISHFPNPMIPTFLDSTSLRLQCLLRLGELSARQNRHRAIASSPCVHLSNCTPYLRFFHSDFKTDRIFEGTASYPGPTTPNPLEPFLTYYTRGTPLPYRAELWLREDGSIPPVLGSSKNSSTISLMTQPSVHPRGRATDLLLAVSPRRYHVDRSLVVRRLAEIRSSSPSLCMPYIFPNHISSFLTYLTTFTMHFFPSSPSFLSSSPSFLIALYGTL